MVPIAAHKVICLYCKQQFDASVEPFIKPNNGRRYAHLECHEKAAAARSEEEIAKENLENYIKELFETDVLSQKIRAQIRHYLTEYNYTYSGILSTLKYAYEIKHMDKEKANGGIGIVGLLYQEAFNYNYNIWLSRQKNVTKVIEEYKPREVKIIIPPPERQPMMKKKFIFSEEDNE